VKQRGSFGYLFEDTLSQADERYDPVRGIYSFTIDTYGWPSGKYDLSVTAGAPSDFPNVSPKSVPVMTINKTR
jgi:hypothetical protein